MTLTSPTCGSSLTACAVSPFMRSHQVPSRDPHPTATRVQRTVAGAPGGGSRLCTPSGGDRRLPLSGALA